jgi:ribose 5-phosphate isomerase B
MALKIAIGSDHAGFAYKQALIAQLTAMSAEVRDFGTHSESSVDYPDFAHPVAEAVAEGQAEFGILLCGSANGVAISANKHAGIRAALCWSEEVVRLARQHNNANIICLPARFLSLDQAHRYATVFIQTAFEGGRHQLRIDKINC